MWWRWQDPDVASVVAATAGSGGRDRAWRWCGGRHGRARRGSTVASGDADAGVVEAAVGRGCGGGDEIRRSQV